MLSRFPGLIAVPRDDMAILVSNYRRLQVWQSRLCSVRSLAVFLDLLSCIPALGRFVSASVLLPCFFLCDTLRQRQNRLATSQAEQGKQLNLTGQGQGPIRNRCSFCLRIILIGTPYCCQKLYGISWPRYRVADETPQLNSEPG